MSRREGHHSRSPSLEAPGRLSSRQEEGRSYHRHEHRLRRDRDRDHSHSPGRDHHDRRKKRRSMSPRPVDDGNSGGHRSRNYRARSPGNPRDSHSRRRRSRSRSHSPKAMQALGRSRAPLPSQNQAFSRDKGTDIAPPVEKAKPNFAPTGKLAAASNTVQTAGQTIILKYHEPAEARKPPAKDTWRLYVFKDDEIVDTVQLFEQSCWLFGREAAVADILLEHPSASGQHAVVQFRYVERRGEFGERVGRVRPYVIDLESGNGTFVNEERIPEGRYVEVRDKDVLRFGNSRREYVVQLPRG